MDLGRSAAAATGVGDDDEKRQDAVLVPVPDPLNCHALGLFMMCIRRRGLRRFCGLLVVLVGLLLQAFIFRTG